MEVDELRRTIGLVMYWAEGTKKNGTGRYKGRKRRVLDRVEITNSDPTFISVFLNFLRESYSIDEKKLRARTPIHQTQIEKLMEIEEFWSSLTGIPIAQFNKPTIRKTMYKNPKRKPSEYGVIQLR